MTTRARYLASYHASVGAITNVSQTFSTAQIGAVTSLTDAVNISTDLALSNNFSVTLGGNRTLDNPTNPISGQTYIWIIKQDAGGTNTLAYGTDFAFPGGTDPTLTTTGSATDMIAAVYDGAATEFLCTFTADHRDS